MGAGGSSLSINRHSNATIAPTAACLKLSGVFRQRGWGLQLHVFNATKFGGILSGEGPVAFYY